MDNKVAILRNQQLDDGALLAFTRHMGPLVRMHPYTRRKALYVSPNHNVRIEGMSAAQGDALFERFAQWIGPPQFIYTHRWRVGDVVLWNNASVVHRRDAFPCGQRRFLKRTGFHLPDDLAVPF